MKIEQRTYELKNSKSGFTVVEALLIILVLAVVSFGGYYVWHSQHKTNTSPTSSSTVNTKTSVGSQKYCSNQEKACFYFPSNWTTKNVGPGSSVDDSGGDGVSLTSPSGMVLTYQIPSPGIGGDCSGQPDVFINKVIQNTNVKYLYVVEVGNNSSSVNKVGLMEAANNGQPPQIGDTGTCSFTMLWPSNQVLNTNVSFTGNNSQNNSINASDLSTAVQILQSLYYTTNPYSTHPQ